jgi:hypothetical protein
LEERNSTPYQHATLSARENPTLVILKHLCDPSLQVSLSIESYPEHLKEPPLIFTVLLLHPYL